jgi:hypothetical protein
MPKTVKSRQNVNFIKMKKLGKLNLKDEKILSQEELINFRGGSGSGDCEKDCPSGEFACCCTSGGTTTVTCESSVEDCWNAC